MTANEFLEKHRHEVMGLVCDAALAGRSGAELALWLRQTMKQVDQRLLAIYHEFQPAQPASSNHKRTA